MGAESFTILAVLEARNQASEVFAKVDESLDKFSDTAKRAADTAKGAGDSIDESLYQTASGADALDVATARVTAAQEKAARTADEQAQAEKTLLDAHKAAAGAADDDAASQYRLMEANEKLTQTTKANAAAQKELAGAQKIAAAADKETVEAAAASAAAQKKSEGNSAALASGLGKIGKVAGITALGLGVVGALAVKAAGNFQSLTAHLVTDAGESAKNLQMVRAGILSISGATGTSATDITNAMYHIESAGIHAGAGLAVAKVAAEGAKVGGADLDTVSKTLVGTLTSYGMRSNDAGVQTEYATQMMNELIATVGSGDMRMQDLASSLGSVTPLASAAGLSFAQVGGAVATMTSQNMSAQRATQDLNNLLRNVVKPSKVASTEMRYLGLSANTVSQSLKGQGLTGVMDTFTKAILANSKSGMVTLGFYKQMAPATKSLAEGILAGKVSTQQLTTAMKGMTPQQAQIISQFKASASGATGLKQTYTAALASLTGGATGLNTSLMLTGKNASVFAANVAKIAAEGKKAGSSVDNWSVIQGTFNQKVDMAKTALENTGIAIGTAILPAATKLFSMIGKILIPVAEWTSRHKTLTEILFTGVTALAATVAAAALASKAFKAVKGTVDDVSKAVKGASAAFQRLTGRSKTAAAGQQADARQTAAVQEESASEGAAAQEEASGEAAAAAETDAAETAAANETAAAESSAGWLTAAAATVGGWAKAGGQMIASAAKWVVQGAVKVGLYVAENVAGAATTMGAWIAANAVMLLGIGLVVALVAIAVVEIVKHWHSIVTGVVDAWHAVYKFSSKIISDVVNFIKSHWVLIVGIFLGPIGLVVALVIKHWDLIEKYFKLGVQKVEQALSWFISLPVRFHKWLGSALSAVTSEGSKVLGWFTSLPARVLSGLGNLGSDLFNAGKHAISMLISGLKSIPVIGTMIGIAGDIADHLPHSPAKKGPLSGSGSPDVSGAKVSTMLAAGIASRASTAVLSARQLAARVKTVTDKMVADQAHKLHVLHEDHLQHLADLGIGSSGGTGSSYAGSAIAPAVGTSGGGGPQIVIDVHDNHVMSNADIDLLTQKIGKVLASRGLPAAGRKTNIR